MKKMKRSINRQFSSEKLEAKFLKQQLSGILNFHKLVTWMIFFMFLFIIFTCLMVQNYLNATALILMSFLNIGQYIYFKMRPSMSCLIVINIYNLSIACMRIYTAIFKVESLSQNDQYLEGTGYFIIHICLLMNPYLTTNIMIMFLIFLINMAAEWIIDGQICYQGLVMIFHITLFLCKLKIDLEMKRNLFIQQQQKSKWESIVKILIEQPYVTVKFDGFLLKFNFVESNQAARKLNIKDSESMRNVLRKMTILQESRQQKEQNLELYIFNLIETYNIDNRSLFPHKEIHVAFDHKTQYMVKIFPVDQEFRTFLLTLHNISYQEFQKKQQKTIINQQIGFCNVLNEQILSVLKLRKILSGKQKQITNYLDQQKYSLLNYTSLFKTDQKIQLKQFSLKEIIIEIKQLFPKQKVYVDTTNILTISSDSRIIKLLLFNLFTLLNDNNLKQVFVIKIQKSSDLTNNLIQIEINSKTVNFKRLQKIHSLEDKQLVILNLTAIQKKEQLQNLMIKKLLRYVSPNEKLDFQQGLTEDSVQLRFQLYENLDKSQNLFQELLQFKPDDYQKLII